MYPWREDGLTELRAKALTYGFFYNQVKAGEQGRKQREEEYRVINRFVSALPPTKRLYR